MNLWRQFTNVVVEKELIVAKRGRLVMNTGAVIESPAGTTSATAGASGLTFGQMFLVPTATVAALGTNQATAAPITTGFTLVSAADATVGVRLPTAVAGSVVIIKNNAAAVLKVWPATGDGINAIAVDSNYVLASLTSSMLIAYNATTWYSLPLVAS